MTIINTTYREMLQRVNREVGGVPVFSPVEAVLCKIASEQATVITALQSEINSLKGRIHRLETREDVE